MSVRKIIIAYILLLLFLLGGCGQTETIVQNQTVEYSETYLDLLSTEANESLIFEKNETTGLEKLAESLEPKLNIIPNVRGIFITGPTAGSERMSTLVDMVERTPLNTVVIDVKNDEGHITYEMDCEKAKNMDACIRYVTDMPALIEELHSKNIFVIGRIVCFKDPVLAEYDDELALKKPDGTPISDAYGLSWVNPYKEGVWDYLCSVAEQASEDGFDEIQFDYVRFPVGDDANAADYGVDMEEYPRYEGLTDFFEYISKRLHDSNIVFGADLFGTVMNSETDKDRTGQDYVQIAELCDNICPMIYPSHYYGGAFGLDVPDAHPYELINYACLESKRVIDEAGLPDRKEVHVRPWLQSFTATWVGGHISYGSNEIAEQIKAVYDSGYNDFILWNAVNRYDEVEEALSMIDFE